MRAFLFLWARLTNRPTPTETAYVDEFFVVPTVGRMFTVSSVDRWVAVPRVRRWFVVQGVRS